MGNLRSAFRVRRRNEDFYSRRNRLGASLIRQQQQEERERAREKELNDTSIEKILQAV